MTAATAIIDASTHESDLPYRAVKEIAALAGPLGLELVSVSGSIDAVVQRHEVQMAHLNQLVNEAHTVSEQNAQIVTAAKHAQGAVTQSANETHQKVQKAIESLETWAVSADSSNQRILGLTNTLDSVSKIAKSIETIASSTNLLALNATIEAARAGDAGRGFAVVAQEVKALSNQTREASKNIQQTLVVLTQEFSGLMQVSQQNLKMAREMSGQSGNDGASLLGLSEAFEQVQGIIQQVTSGASAIEARSKALQSGLSGLVGDVEALDTLLQDGNRRLESVSLIGESIMQATNTAGVRCADSHYIDLAEMAAQKIGEAFAEALKQGRISHADLFDHVYAPIANTNPQQFMTRFVSLTDSLLPSIQEPILESDSHIIFCAAVDSKGFLPTHNLKFSKPQKPNDIEWNTAFSRNRRLFNDRVGLRAGANSGAALVQAYRRDMGNGQFVMMKDISAPIMVDGQHWGGFRIGVKHAG